MNRSTPKDIAACKRQRAANNWAPGPHNKDPVSEFLRITSSATKIANFLSASCLALASGTAAMGVVKPFDHNPTENFAAAAFLTVVGLGCKLTANRVDKYANNANRYKLKYIL